MKANLNLPHHAAHYLIAKLQYKQIGECFLFLLIIFKNNILIFRNK